MKYVALLRAINVGGNSIIKMADLRACFEKHGFKNVVTYIQSGNVIFESSEKSIVKLESALEKILSKEFAYASTVMVRSHAEIKKVLQEVPKEWIKGADLRCYIAFVKAPLTSLEVVKDVELKDGVDFVSVGKGVVYMGTLMSGLTKSKLSKLPTKKTYRSITIRNYATTQKIAALME